MALLFDDVAVAVEVVDTARGSAGGEGEDSTEAAGEAMALMEGMAGLDGGAVGVGGESRGGDLSVEP